jgi:serine/threonine-protein kinase
VGLEVSFREVDGGGAAGTVVGLRPGAGTAVPRGSTVTVDVARAGSAPTSGAPAGDDPGGATGDEQGGADDPGTGEGGEYGEYDGAGQGDDGFFDGLFG